MRVCLFEDQGVVDLQPLVLTRPVFELLCGQSSLGSKQCGYFAPPSVGALIRTYLADLFRLQEPHVHVNDPGWLCQDSTLLVNGRWLTPPGSAPDLPGPCVALVGEEVAYALVPAELLVACSPDTIDDCLEMWKRKLPARKAGGTLVRYPWDLVQQNREQLCHDYQNVTPPHLPVVRHSAPGLRISTSFPPALVGPPERLLIDPTARLEPMIVADTTRGPIVVDREAVVTAFSRLEGPCYIGPRTQILGARIRTGTTIGPNCRIGGEIEASIIHGHSNKYHDGFLGHSYVGEWVNFGAGTQNSDLRNDYGEVTVMVNGQSVATGLRKVGCFIGDHTKTGLGTLLNTGTSIGVFCHLLPAGQLIPRSFPSFSSWWHGMLVENGDLRRLLSTAEEVMHRRGSQFTETHAALFRYLFKLTAGERDRALREAQRQGLRRSA